MDVIDIRVLLGFTTTLGLVFWLLFHKWIQGLKGGFGKGVWSESSPQMVAARDNRRLSAIAAAIAFVGLGLSFVF